MHGQLPSDRRGSSRWDESCSSQRRGAQAKGARHLSSGRHNRHLSSRHLVCGAGAANGHYLVGETTHTGLGVPKLPGCPTGSASESFCDGQRTRTRPATQCVILRTCTKQQHNCVQAATVNVAHPSAYDIQYNTRVPSRSSSVVSSNHTSASRGGTLICAWPCSGGGTLLTWPCWWKQGCAAKRHAGACTCFVRDAGGIRRPTR